MPPRRVLIICYYYPPTPSAGSFRMAGLARHLPRFGWEATVVTPRQAGRTDAPGTVVETADADMATRLKALLGMSPQAALKDQVWSGAGTPSSGLRLRSRLIDQAKALIAFPDTNRGWIPRAAAAARRCLAEEQFDAVLSSCPPPSAHVAGRRAAVSSGLPWVADLRDLWSDDRFSTAPRWRRRLDRWHERRTFRRATALVTVSEPLAEELRQLHPRLPVHSVLNGFDPDTLNPGEELDPMLTITHTGTYHQGRRDPSDLFIALASAIANGSLPRDRVRVRLFVRNEPWLRTAAAHHGVADLVELAPWAPIEEVRRAQRRSQVNLLLHWGGPREAGVVTAKVFEYLAARRPILVLGGSAGALTALVEETGAGVHITEPGQLQEQLASWWNELKTEGAVAWRGHDELLGRYSHLRMAEEFAAVLDSVQPR